MFQFRDVSRDTEVCNREKANVATHNTDDIVKEKWACHVNA